MVAKRKREGKALEEAKLQKEKSLLEGVFFLLDKVFKPLKAMLNAYEAILRPKQTNEERFRAYPNPNLETKRLDIFQKMIEGTQTLLNKKLDKQRSFEDHVKSHFERGQVPCGLGNLVSSIGSNMEDPHKRKKKHKRSRYKKCSIYTLILNCG